MEDSYSLLVETIGGGMMVADEVLLPVVAATGVEFAGSAFAVLLVKL